jgi:hypothetical protein
VLTFADGSVVKAQGAKSGVALGSFAKVLDAREAMQAERLSQPWTRERPLRMEVMGGQDHDGRAIEAFEIWQEPPLAIIVDAAIGGCAMSHTVAIDDTIAVNPSISSIWRPSCTLPVAQHPRTVLLSETDMRPLTRRKSRSATSCPYSSFSRSDPRGNELSPETDWFLVFGLKGAQSSDQTSNDVGQDCENSDGTRLYLRSRNQKIWQPRTST